MGNLAERLEATRLDNSAIKVDTLRSTGEVMLRVEEAGVAWFEQQAAAMRLMETLLDLLSDINSMSVKAKRNSEQNSRHMSHTNFDTFTPNRQPHQIESRRPKYREERTNQVVQEPKKTEKPYEDRRQQACFNSDLEPTENFLNLVQLSHQKKQPHDSLSKLRNQASEFSRSKSVKKGRSSSISVDSSVMDLPRTYIPKKNDTTCYLHTSPESESKPRNLNQKLEFGRTELGDITTKASNEKHFHKHLGRTSGNNDTFYNLTRTSGSKTGLETMSPNALSKQYDLKAGQNIQHSSDARSGVLYTKYQEPQTRLGEARKLNFGNTLESKRLEKKMNNIASHKLYPLQLDYVNPSEAGAKPNVEESDSSYQGW